ncbi:MAG: exo-rhamnogalacturonan lyase family protein, partial [Armatimonadota bacterium]
MWIRKAVLIVAASLLWMRAHASDSPSPLSVSLYITNPSDLPRTGWPVSGGVPIPMDATDGRAAISRPSQLSVVDNQGNAVPAQFRVLARWNGPRDDSTRPIKWLLVDLQADVPARGTAVYKLVSYPALPLSYPAVSVTDDGEGVTVDTGALQFRIRRKGFNLFDWVRRGEDTLVQSSMENGVVYRASDGAVYHSATSAPDGYTHQVVVEEAGPLKAVIRVSGAYKLLRRDYSRRVYLGYSARIYAYAGHDWVRVVYTLENNGRGVQNQAGDPYEVVYIRDLTARLTANLGTYTRLSLEGYTTYPSEGERYSLEQTRRLRNPANEADNFEYTVWKENTSGLKQAVATGKRAVGWADLSNGTCGITLTSRWFWQNYPKSLRVSRETIELGIFPEGLGDVSGKDGSGNPPTSGTLYRFRGGYYKTTDMMFWFHGDDVSQRSALIEFYQHPIVLRTAPEWYNTSEAFLEPIAPRGGWKPAGTGMDSRLQEALDRYEAWMRARYDAGAASTSKPEVLRSLLSVRESRQQGNLDLYGWEHFGCVGWQSGHSAQHYDWLWGILLQFLRTGDIGFWELAQEIGLHSVDIDLIHLRGPDRAPMFYLEGNYLYWLNRYERDAHDLDRQGDLAPKRSHSWVRGKVVYYLLTGDERFFEDAWAMAEATRQALRLDPGQFERPETRFMGWSIEGLLAVYGVTYEKPMLDAAMELFGLILKYESLVDDVPQGYTNVRGYYGLKYDELITNEAYYAGPLIQLYRATRDPTVRSYLLREAYWVKDRYVLGGGFDARGWYYPLCGVVDNWKETDPEAGNRYTQNLWLLVDLIAFAWEQTGLEEFRDLARRMFADSILHWGYWRTKDNVTPIPPDSRDPIYMSEWYQVSKEQGKVQRAFQYYLWLEANPPPAVQTKLTVSASAAPAEPEPGAPVKLTGETSRSARTTWYFGDGSKPVYGKGALSTEHVYTAPGVYKATFEAISISGAIARTSVNIKVGVQPKIELKMLSDRTSVAPGQVVGLEVEVANQGKGTAYELKVIVPLPEGASVVPESHPVNRRAVRPNAVSDSELVVALGTLAPGATASITF